ncbi:alpha/beta hydrolase [Duganella sp. sic0402]|uniref:alpha/beta fold hydrolase n=1 Tax=Duganella sp. sic0402 TaxID=2854786 RepID=UPI001C482EB8|nr:alpha/beta hydrolase [Duganella sp. sic0402]MBV7538740.1 alpha/beta hydrolase [Duganella sp. sic0402]
MIRRAVLLACGTLLLSAAAQAARVLDQATINIAGKERRYYHLHDTGNFSAATPILLLHGSGCKDYSSRMASYFERYPAPLSVYYLDKAGVQKNSQGENCAADYTAADFLENRVSDNLAFIDNAPELKRLTPRSLAIVGFSEGGTVAPLIALRSPKAGWLATAGSGGLPQSQVFLIFADRGVKPYAQPFSRDYFLQTYADIKAHPDSVDKEFFGHSYRYWSSHLFYDPLLTYRQLNMPMIAAMGEKDDSEAIESGRALRDYFAQHPEKNFTFIEYPNAGHALQTPEKSHLQDFIASLARWFKQ